MNNKNKLFLKQIQNKLFLILNIFLFCYTVYLSNKYVKRINYYNVENIIISGNNYVKKENVLSIIENDIYQNDIFSINLQEMQNKLNLNSFIYSSKLYTVFPSSIHIEIDEINPIGIFEKNKKTYFIDYSTNLIEINLKNDFRSINYFNVPTISFTTEDLNEKMISMLLKNIYNNSNFLFESINEIKYNIDNIEINLDKNTKLIISNNAYSLIQLNILHEFLNQINQNISIYEYVDFRISNQIIVKEKNIKI